VSGGDGAALRPPLLLIGVPSGSIRADCSEGKHDQDAMISAGRKQGMSV
jgi:hypothetical protein